MHQYGGLAPPWINSCDFSLALFDAEDRLALFNDAFRSLHHAFDGVDLGGKSFSELVRLSLEGGEIAGLKAAREPEEWLAERLRRHRECGAPHRQQLADGSWLEIRERRLPTGGILCVWLDVTELVGARSTLEDGLEFAGDGFALWNQAGRCVLGSPDFARDVLRREAPLQAGESYRSAFVALAESGALDIEETPEAWMADFMARHARPLSTVVLDYRDGRHLLLRQRRTRAGSMATIVADVTEMVAKERELEEGRRNLQDKMFQIEMSRDALERQGANLADMVEQLEEAQSEIRIGQARQKAILDAMGDALLIIDHNGRVVAANPAAERMFLIPATGLVGAALRRLIPDGVAPSDGHCGEGFTSEREAMRGDGERFPAEVTVASFSAAGEPLLVATIRDITARKALERELHRLARTDPLTGALNRRSLFEIADAEVSRARRHRHPMCIVAADIDCFKFINDRHGHGVGDEALRLFVGAAHATLRASDALGRLGGEEFAVLLPETPLAGAVEVAEKLRHAVAAIRVPSGAGAFGFTTSLGVAQWLPGEASIEPALARADEALYQAKRDGRDRVVLKAD
ncbi:MAG: diguanylate cyclase [Alphaproteobacteria bacterium]|nr:diguanylate cyclase [Alphaproteobacteria bacterium]